MTGNNEGEREKEGESVTVRNKSGASWLSVSYLNLQGHLGIQSAGWVCFDFDYTVIPFVSELPGGSGHGEQYCRG